MTLSVTFEYESESHRWIAELDGIPGLAPVLAYGKTKEEACRKVQAAVFWYLSECLEDGSIPQVPGLTFTIAA